MKEKLYFTDNNDGLCYPLSYFKWLMDFENWDELTLREAKKQDVCGEFWCKKHEAPMDRFEGGCGNACKGYVPRNGKTGCCKYYSLNFYEPSDKVLILHK